MRKYLVATACFCALAVPTAVSADNWTGFYIGAHAGFGWGDWDGPMGYDDLAAVQQAFPNDPRFIFDGSDKSVDGEGALGGLQLGGNYQMGTIVVGVEADVTWTKVDGSGRFTPFPNFPAGPGGPGAPDWKFDHDLDVFGTIRGRLGTLVTNQLLVYGTAGAAWGSAEGKQTVIYAVTPPGVSATGKADENHFGWTIGGGLEYVLTKNLSLKSEYLYVDLGSEDYDFIGTQTATGLPHDTDHHIADLDLHVLRIGLNYKLTGF
jgi:outer membrane immunogenic protein